MKETGKKLSLKENAPFLCCRASSLVKEIVENCRGQLGYFASFYGRGWNANVDQRAYQSGRDLRTAGRDAEPHEAEPGNGGLFNELARDSTDESLKARPAFEPVGDELGARRGPCRGIGIAPDARPPGRKVGARAAATRMDPALAQVPIC